MLKYVKRYLQAKSICSRYGFKFRPSFEKYKGTVYLKGVVSVSIFHKYFWEIFWHEIGHIVDYKTRGELDTKAGYAEIYPKNCHNDIYECTTEDAVIISCEVQATRFALKMLRKTGGFSREGQGFLVGNKALASYWPDNWKGDEYYLSTYSKAVKRCGVRY